MRVLSMLFLGFCLGACASIGMQGTVVGNEYTSPNSAFTLKFPEAGIARVVDGQRPHYDFVDLLTDSGVYSIEYFYNAGPEDEEEFRSTTISFMEDYIPKKCGPDSFERVEGHFSKISGKSSYDFLTSGVRPMGRPSFLYGRSIFLGPRSVAICMFFEDRRQNEGYSEFHARFDMDQFDRICSSIEDSN